VAEDVSHVHVIQAVSLTLVYFCLFFFFSSRRRHTRWPRDWSSDVCSSDLFLEGRHARIQDYGRTDNAPNRTARGRRGRRQRRMYGFLNIPPPALLDQQIGAVLLLPRSGAGRGIDRVEALWENRVSHD